MTRGCLPDARGTTYVPAGPGCSRLSRPLCKVSLPRHRKAFVLTYVLMSRADHLTKFPPTIPTLHSSRGGQVGMDSKRVCFLFLPHQQYTMRFVFKTRHIQCLEIFPFYKGVNGSFCELCTNLRCWLDLFFSLCAQNPPRSQAQVSMNAGRPRASQWGQLANRSGTVNNDELRAGRLLGE